jgi:heptaprenyl diphosphate synthase
VWSRDVRDERAGVGTPPSAWNTRRVARLGILSAVGTALFTLESLVPLPLPFLKIGLSNIATLLALIIGGPADACIVLLARVLGGSLLTGSFLGPAFVLSFCAGVASTGVMSLLSVVLPRGRTLNRGLLGPFGISLAGSTAHVVTQLVVVAFLFGAGSTVFALLPFLLATALVGGAIIGLTVLRILPALALSLSGELQRSLWRRIRMGDWVVIAALIVALGMSMRSGVSREGTVVTVEQHGQVVATLDLKENRAFEIGGTRIEVRNGAVRVAQATCPNQVCVRTGWRSRAGDLIICVPNGLFVRIGGAPAPAAITG